LFFFGQRPLVPLLLLSPPFFPNYYFLVHHPATGMISISLHMQWPLTSQLHGSFLKENNCFFFITDQTPRPQKVFFL
jgi:hypothetical protein